LLEQLLRAIIIYSYLERSRTRCLSPITMSTEELNAEEPSVDSIAVEVQTLHNSFLSLEKNGEVTNTENKLMVHLSKTSTSRSTNTEARTWNIAVTTTSLPSSPSQNSPVQYVDERSKAMERKAELEELRNRNELTKKKGRNLTTRNS